jgi:hypothetical protein
MQRFDLAVPFIAAILFYAVSPLLSRQVGRVIVGEISQGRAHTPNLVEKYIPYYLTPSSISDYVEYSVDAFQVFPSLLLPIVGAVFGFANGVQPTIALGFLIFTCIMAIAMSAWILTRSVSDYVSRKWHGYSIMMIVGIIINVLGIVLTFIFA